MKQQHTLQPKVRFPEFEGDWDYKPLGEFVSNKSKKFNPKNNEDNLKCVELEHIDQNTGRLLGFISSLDTNSTKNVFKKGEVLYGKLRPYLNKYYYCEFDGVCSSEIWVLSGNNFSNKLISQLTQTNYFKFVTLKTTGSKMPRADWNVLSETEFCVPLDIPEQQKIADYLSTIDTKINLLEEKKAQFGLYKKAMMQKLFSQEIRFKDDNGNDFPEWEEKRLGEVLDYEQPTKYIVKSTEYSNNFRIPVLTAGKSFILGYTNEFENIFKNHPVIIFDDFTTAFKFVDFDFKVKSSAMKILKIKENKLNIRYIFSAMELIEFPISDHKRYWISEYQNLLIPYPSIPEQQKIADFLSVLDASIEKVTEQMSKTQSFKKAMLQQMFV